MRPKRTKQYKRLMALYSMSFGFREPYQILVDGNFMQTAIRYKMDICKQLCMVLLGNTKQIKKQGKDGLETELALKQFERRRCPHRKPVSSAECLASIIGNDNPHNYCVATQNETLRRQFRVIAGVPLLYINRTVLIVEPPSGATLDKAKQTEITKTHASVEELSFLRNANSDTQKKNVEPQKPRKVHKGPKQPNPLSCKKKLLPSPLKTQVNKKELSNDDFIEPKELDDKKRKHPIDIEEDIEHDKTSNQLKPHEENSLSGHMTLIGLKYPFNVCLKSLQ
ncbi:13523_t:CDS:2 [Cetraspora pellucida]|uniref:U three protein 23 n=1 Tax=Cetraspora pellucida TaxID=1433469 RepID=A0A9N9HLZ2_9GLOM|nr:13523_t:CDS:2 [Cetraspora pellucida]